MGDNAEFFAPLIIGLLIGTMVGMFIVSITIEGSISKLGQSICEEEYDMDFKSYSYKEDTLECKPKTKIYDDIKVRIINRGE